MAGLSDLQESFDGTTLPSGWEVADILTTYPSEFADGKVTWPNMGASASSFIITTAFYDVPNESIVFKLDFTLDDTIESTSGVFTVYLLNLSTVTVCCTFGLQDKGSTDPGLAAGSQGWNSGGVYVGAAFDWNRTDQWWRLRFGDDTYAVDSSPDGTEWTERSANTSPIDAIGAPQQVLIGAQWIGDSSTVFSVDEIGSGPPSPVSTAGAQWSIEGPPTAYATARWFVDGPVPLEEPALAGASWASGGPLAEPSLAVAEWGVEPAPPVEWDGALSTLDVAANPGEFGVLPGLWLTGATARVAVAMATPTFALGAGPPVWAGATAVVMIDANPGAFVTGVQVVGDSFYVPVALTGLSGVGVANLTSATLQPGEPYTHGATRSWWFRYTAAGPGTLTISSLDTTPHWIDIYQGDALDSLTVIGSSQRALSPVNLTVPVSTGTYYIRVIGSVADSDIAISYSATVEDAPLIAELTGSPAGQTPAAVNISVLNALPDELVEFTFSPPPSDWIPGDIPRPIVLGAIQADSTGTIAGAALTVPEVQAGSHTISVRGATSGRTDTLTFTVTADPPPIEVIPEPAELPEFVVGYWNLHDAAPGGLGLYVFPINPSQMTSPYAPRNITSEHTTAADGQPILWEGGLTAHDWTFSGYVDTQAFHDALVAFASLNRRLLLKDHRGRVWLVGLRGIDMRPVRNIGKPWAHNYTMQAQIYGQVVI